MLARVVDGRRWFSDGTLSWSFRDRFQLVKKELQYRAVKEIIRRALDVWSDSSQGAILFEDVSPNDRAAPRRGQLDIQFAKFDHGDKEAFDGRGGIVAHSAYPPEGIVHFDASEHWSTDGKTGLDLRFVALHEIGHALGLRHSRDPNAVMHPYYREQLKNGFRLSEDDIRGIRALYPLLQSSSSESTAIDESSSERHVEKTGS
ncbi:unnamed protein product [Toxocara canis]|uniref:ZnMc domain-containing protein n=1 Tax=Toxocara canis TaxID=6265 RepID=A0A183UCM2_TOXCA|nr:unnamed protein product [Toxocara canis]